MQRSSSKKLTFTLLFTMACSATVLAQRVDHYTPESLMQQSKSLQEKAQTSNGAAAITLEKYGADFTTLSFRSQDGGAELHQHFADIFIVVDGTATLLSGGELAAPKESSPGEINGIAILHATSIGLAKGDIIHIPANTPHQLLIPKGSSLTYFVIKVREKE